MPHNAPNAWREPEPDARASGWFRASRWIGPPLVRAPGDDRCCVERVIGVVRAFLALSALAAILLDPTEPSAYSGICYGLLGSYALCSLAMLAALFAVRRISVGWSVGLHAFDVAMSAAITLFTEGPNSPFFVLFSFVSLAAAYRWGFAGTVATALLSIVLLVQEAVVVGTSTPVSFGLIAGDFDLNRFVVRAVYLLVLGLLVGYLGENENRRRDENWTIATVLGSIRAASGIGGTIRAVFGPVLHAFAARRVALVVTENTTGRTFVWRAAASEIRTHAHFEAIELQGAERDEYLFDPGAPGWHAALRSNGLFDVAGVDAFGARQPRHSTHLPEPLSKDVTSGVLCVSAVFGESWHGRLLLFDPVVGVDRIATVAFAQRLLAAIAPAAHEVYLLARLRSRAEAIERGRIGRELHDGLVQSLIASELQIAAVRRQMNGQPAAVSDQLARVQTSVREQIRALRDLMDGLRTTSGGGTVADLRAVVDRFRLETGIEAQFFTNARAIRLSSRATHEMLRIVQEGLVNVRRHSGARHVIVRATTDDGHCRVSIEDDGRGFPFDGRRSQRELGGSGCGPTVIMERVKALGGELSVLSTPGEGARLDIELPLGG